MKSSEGQNQNLEMDSMGSQCSCISSGVTCVNTSMVRLAAVFWINCRRSRKFLFKHVNSDEMKCELKCGFIPIITLHERIITGYINLQH